MSFYTTNHLFQLLAKFLLLKNITSFTIPSTQLLSHVTVHQLAIGDVFHTIQTHVPLLHLPTFHNIPKDLLHTSSLLNDPSSYTNYPKNPDLQPTSLNFHDRLSLFLREPMTISLLTIHNTFCSFNISPNWILTILSFSFLSNMIIFPLTRLNQVEMNKVEQNVKFPYMNKYHQVSALKLYSGPFLQTVLWFKVFNILNYLIHNQMLKESLGCIRLEGLQNLHQLHDGSVSAVQYFCYMSVPLLVLLWQYVSIGIIRKVNGMEKKEEITFTNVLLAYIVWWIALRLPPLMDFYWVVNSMMGLYGTVYWKNKLDRLNEEKNDKINCR